MTVDEAFDTAGSPTKRKRPGTLTVNEVSKQISHQPPSVHTDLIDAIKKRRRVIRVKSVF